MSFLIYLSVYIFNVFFLIISAILNNRRFTLLLFVVMATTIIFISGLRIAGGTDLPAYLSIFDEVVPFSFDTYSGQYMYWSPGFRFVLSILKLVSDSHVFYLFSVSLLIHLLFYVSIKKIKGDYYLAYSIFVLFFFISYSLNAVAQFIVMLFFVFLLREIYQKKWGTIFSASLLLSYFHPSGALIILAYIFARLNLTLINFLIVLAVCIFLSITGITNIFAVSFLNIEQYIFLESYFTSTIGLQDITQRVILLILCIFCQQKYLNSRFDKMTLNIYLFSFIIFILFSSAPVLATRLNIFFKILEIVILSRAFAATKNVGARFSLASVVLLIYTPNFYIAANNSNNILEY